MSTFEFNQEINRIDQRFIPLGKPEEKITASEKNTLIKKINHKRKSNPTANWGTIGWADNTPFHPKGEIHFSKVGNLKSKSVTLEQVKNIYKLNPKSKGKEFVTERYINLDKVDFGFDKKEFHVNELPELRFTLFLQPDEGAVVYYQFSDAGKFHDSDADIEYIQPNSTGFDHNTNRDRLNYFMPIIPSEQLENKKEHSEILVRKESESATSFIIKILTFKRNNLTANELLHEGLNQLNIANALKPLTERNVSEKYDLLVFDSKKNVFGSTQDGLKIDYTKKTLFLLHGTFSTTSGSFGKLFDNGQNGDADTFLKNLVEERIYDQVIAFDHPTIIHDSITNCSHLYNYFGNNQFNQPVDLIGTSRGAIVCHTLAMDKRNKNFTCGKILSISGGFGCGYFKAKGGIKTFLKIIGKGAGPVGAIITLLAQFSLEFFTQQPGSRLLTPGSKRLDAIISANPKSPITVYQNIQVDWNKRLVERRFKRIVMVLVDAIAKIALGKKHDLVIGYNQQGISPAGRSFKPIHLTSSHTKNFEPDFPKPEIRSLIKEFLDS